MKYEVLQQAAEYCTKSKEWQKAFDLSFHAQLETINEQQAEIDALKAQRDVAIKHIADWCVGIQENGYSWDYWDDYCKDACFRGNALPEIRVLLDEEIAKARGDL